MIGDKRGRQQTWYVTEFFRQNATLLKSKRKRFLKPPQCWPLRLRRQRATSAPIFSVL